MDSLTGDAALPMPGFPTPELQAGFIGSSNRQAIDEAWNFYVLMEEQRNRFGSALGRDSHVLDFGCGWGRIIRMFLRDVPESNIWCADSQTLALDICRRTGVPGRMVQLQQMPPSDLPAGLFDAVFAYSVFSHLSPKAHDAWEEELARITRPDGMVFVTTQPRWFLDTCRNLRDHPDQIVSRWHQLLAESFVDYHDSVSRYDAGEFLYADTGGGPDLPAEFYGQAVVPRGYFEQQWGRNFDVLDFIADLARCPQAVAVLRRRR